MLNGCNIGGGEVTLNIFPGWRSPWLSFINIRKRVEYRQEEPKGVGGEEEEELYFFSMRFSTSCKKVKVNLSCLENSLETLIFMQISDFNQLMSWVVAKKSLCYFSAKLKRKMIVCMKVKVELNCPYLSVYVVFVDLSSVLDKESVDLKVLVQMKIYQFQKDSL